MATWKLQAPKSRVRDIKAGLAHRYRDGRQLDDGDQLDRRDRRARVVGHGQKAVAGRQSSEEASIPRTTVGVHPDGRGTANMVRSSAVNWRVACFGEPGELIRRVANLAVEHICVVGCGCRGDASTGGVDIDGIAVAACDEKHPDHISARKRSPTRADAEQIPAARQN